MSEPPENTTGFPSPAQDHAETSLNLHTYAVRHPDATYFLRAQGEAMRSAGIFAGDVLVVDRAIDPRTGDVVIAIVDGVFLVRRWERDAAGIRLTCDQAPDIVSGAVQVWGVVTFVVHAPNRRGRS